VPVEPPQTDVEKVVFAEAPSVARQVVAKIQLGEFRLHVAGGRLGDVISNSISWATTGDSWALPFPIQRATGQKCPPAPSSMRARTAPLTVQPPLSAGSMPVTGVPSRSSAPTAAAGSHQIQTGGCRSSPYGHRARQHPARLRAGLPTRKPRIACRVRPLAINAGIDLQRPEEPGASPIRRRIVYWRGNTLLSRMEDPQSGRPQRPGARRAGGPPADDQGRSPTNP